MSALIPEGKKSASYTFKIAKKKKKKWYQPILIFGLGSLAVGGIGALLGMTWRPHVHLPTHHAKPLIIDGPPTNVPAAPPPVAPERPRPAYGDDYDAQDSEAQADDQPSALAAGGPDPGAPAESQDPSSTQGPAEARAAQAAIREPPEANPPAANPCTHFASLADRVVCASPRLADEDAKLQRLYRMALDSAPEPGLVLEDQRRWTRARERAAAGGPRALSDFYQQRIQELSGPG